MIYLYKQPEYNEFCVIGADPSEGGDYSTFVVLSKKKAEVLMISKSKEESSQLGHSLNHIGKWLNKHTGWYPSIGVERNTGSATLYVLKTLNYPNIYQMPVSFTRTEESPSDNYGWSTNTATRPKMLDDLALAIRQKAISIPSKEVVNELTSFIRNSKTGKPEADQGSHDDLVMALAIAWQLYQTVPYPQAEFDDSEIPDDSTRIMRM